MPLRVRRRNRSELAQGGAPKVVAGMPLEWLLLDKPIDPPKRRVSQPFLSQAEQGHMVLA